MSQDATTAVEEVDSLRLTYVDEVERRVTEMRDRGRDIIGVGGEVDRRPFRQIVREEGASVYPLVAVFMLSVSQLVHSEAWAVQTPDVARTFGLSPAFFNVADLVSQALVWIVPLAVARFVQHRARRALVMLVSAALFSVLTPLTGLAAASWMLFAALVIDAATTSAHGTVSAPLTVDLYPPHVRVRVISVLTSATIVAGLAAQGVVTLLVGPLDLNWRGVFIVLGGLSLLGTIAALGLRDPGYGTYDTERLRAAVREEAPAAVATERVDGPRLTLFEAMRRVWAIRTMRIAMIAILVASLSGPINTYLAFFQADRFSLDAEERSLLALAGGVAGLLSYLALAPVGDRIFQKSPARLFYLSGAIGIVGVFLSALQVYAASVSTVVVLTVSSAALTGLVGPALVVGTLSILPAPLRPQLAALEAMFVFAGSAVGTALLGGLVTSIGVPAAVVLTSLVGICGTVVGMLAGRSVESDMDAMIDDVVEEEAVAQMRAQGRAIPLITAKGIDFSYGQTQVLFGVNFAVEQGEMVSLLGVNGAGKSTLLYVLSGLGLPQRGTVRLEGYDITYLEAHRRAALGITQVQGGMAVFYDLSVLENLRCYAYRVPGGQRELARRIDEALAAFPRLADRRNSPAATLSGGEQQMLGLARAYIMRPKLLLIDELSLGLAPIIVAQLVDMVHAINATGTSVVLVEQSVNIALSVTERAYFMEHGQVMFEGSSAQLKNEKELLRSVFLAGAGTRSR